MYGGTLLSDLPVELLETILVLCAADGHPLSIAAIAQTCRQFRALVYDAPDRHLWRTLFLTIFDDPRVLVDSPADIDWHCQATERLWTRLYIHQHAKRLQVQKKPHLRSTRSTLFSVPELGEDPGDPLTRIRALRALVSIVKTAAPSPCHQRLLDAQAAEAHPPLTQVHAETPLAPPQVQLQSPSLNVEWLQHTLSDGLPYSLTKLLSYGHAGRNWRSALEVPDLCQLTSYLGFLPVPIIETSTASTSPSRSRRTRGAPSRSKPLSSSELVDMSVSMQRQRARDNARSLAFNMRYLSERRNWGPYLAFPPRPLQVPQVIAVESAEEGSDEDDVDDEDYVPPANDSVSSATPEPPEGIPQVPGANPPPDQLYPDWTWLAAARIIAEWKLRAHVDPVEIARLEAWDNLREGAWKVPAPVSEHHEAGPSIEYGKEWKKHEHDWAGAQGLWRRLVCWLDYDDLIYHNSYGAYIEDENLEEAWIIVPMSIQIIGYSASASAAYPDRPTIHVKGEMGGAGWVGSVDTNDEDIRYVHGKISMLPDGNVRWSLNVRRACGLRDCGYSIQDNYLRQNYLSTDIHSTELHARRMGF